MRDNLLQANWSEKGSTLYIHISKDNIVHVMIPLTGMDDAGIGTDNTCKAAVALQDFFGKSREKNKSCLFQLENYKEQLKKDISTIKGHQLGSRQSAQKRLQELRFRLGQVENYIQVFLQLAKDELDNELANEENKKPSVLRSLNGEHPQYPDAFKRLLHQEGANVYAICLAPQPLDPSLRFKGLYWFAVERQYSGQRPLNSNALDQVLLSVYRTIALENFRLPSSKEEFLKELQSNIQEKVRQGVRKKDITLSLPLSTWSSFLATYLAQHDVSHAVKLSIRDSQINEKLGHGSWDLNEPVREQDVPDLVETLFNSAGCEIPESTAFVRVNNSAGLSPKVNELSILTQFFIAEVNIYARIHKLLLVESFNFGTLLDENRGLAQSLANHVKTAIESQKSIESAIFDFIDEGYQNFKLKEILNNDQKKDISAIFNKHYSVIAESDHKDEFIFLDDSDRKPNQAIFHFYQGTLCCDFTTWYEEAKLGVIGPKHPFHAAHQERASMPVRLPHGLPEHLTGDIPIGEDELLIFTCPLSYEAVLCFAIEACLSSASEREEALTVLRKWENDRSSKIEITLMLFGIDVQGVEFQDDDSFTVVTYKPEAESQLKYVVQRFYTTQGMGVPSDTVPFSERDKALTKDYFFRLIPKAPGQGFAEMVEEARAKRRQAVAPLPDKHLSYTSHSNKVSDTGENRDQILGDEILSPAPVPAFIPGVGSAVVTGSLFALGAGSFILANTVSASGIAATSAGFALAGATCPFLGVALITLALVMGMGIMYHRNKAVEGSISNWVSRNIFCWGAPAANRNDNNLYSVH